MSTVRITAVWAGCIAPTAALNILPHAVAIFDPAIGGGMAATALVIPHVALATVKAAMVVGMAYLPIKARDAETRSEATFCWLIWAVIATGCLFHAMEGAGRLRDGLAGPVRDAQAASERVASRIVRYEASRRAIPQHSPATAAMVDAARKKVTDATTAREQECGKVGDNCRARVKDLESANSELSAVEERKGLTDQLAAWDSKIEEAEQERERIGRVDEHADGGAANAALLLNFIGLTGVTESGVTKGWPIWLAIILEIWAGLAPARFLPRKPRLGRLPDTPVAQAAPTTANLDGNSTEVALETAPAVSVAVSKTRRPAHPAPSRKPLKTKLAGADTVREWFAHAVRLQDDAPHQRANVFHAAYVAWCEDRGYAPMVIQAFGGIMKQEMGVAAYDKSKRTFYTGIVLTGGPKLSIVRA